jgi:hydroxymethylpyrimidine/phosphomethylpyrimidine kinase
LRAQLASIPLEGIAGVRVGALGSIENAQAAAQFLGDCNVPAVFDPVMRASAGGSLYAGEALAAVRAFMSCGPIVTPNLEEAGQLAGVAMRDVDAMIAAGRALLDIGARAAIVKGGHLEGEPVDILVTRVGVERFSGSRLAGQTRGTGCTLAMALACEIALGRNLVDAVKGARAYVRANIARS